MEIKNSFHISESVSDRIYNSIVRIEIKNILGTGFLTIFNIKGKKLRCIVTCSHIITKQKIKKGDKMDIYYGKKNQEEKRTIHLEKTKRYMKSFKKPVDITIIQVIEEDNVPHNKYLYPDLNYKNGIKHYKNVKTCLAGYPNSAFYNEERHICSGEIINIKNEYEFEHSMDSRHGSSGSPICLIYNQTVIGIHKKAHKSTNRKAGTFIGYILDLLKKENISDNFLELVEESQETDDGEEKEITAKNQIIKKSDEKISIQKEKPLFFTQNSTIEQETIKNLNSMEKSNKIELYTKKINKINLMKKDIEDQNSLSVTQMEGAILKRHENMTLPIEDSLDSDKNNINKYGIVKIEQINLSTQKINKKDYMKQKLKKETFYLKCPINKLESFINQYPKEIKENDYKYEIILFGKCGRGKSDSINSAMDILTKEKAKNKNVISLERVKELLLKSNEKENSSISDDLNLPISTIMKLLNRLLDNKYDENKKKIINTSIFDIFENVPIINFLKIIMNDAHENLNNNSDSQNKLKIIWENYINFITNKLKKSIDYKINEKCEENKKMPFLHISRFCSFLRESLKNEDFNKVGKCRLIAFIYDLLFSKKKF